MSKKDTISLKEFICEMIDKIGIDEFKFKFGVQESTINHWRRGACLPKPEHMETLVKLSKGRVTYQTMIESFNRNPNSYAKKKAALK